MSLTRFVVCALIATVPAAFAAEKKLTREQLPSAVRQTADAQSSGATVRGYSTDTENGQVEYEVSMTINGHGKDVTIAPDGHLLEIEEEVAFQNLPARVQSSLASKAGSGKITRVESLTKSGKLVAYEAQIITGTRHSEIQVGPAGEAIVHAE